MFKYKLIRLIFLCFLINCIFNISNAFSEIGFNNHNKKINLIIDFDPGNFVEDLMMLQLALNSPEVNILGVVTTSSYYSNDPFGSSKVALKFLDIAGRKDIPVAQGLTSKEIPNLEEFLQMNVNEEWAKDYPTDRLNKLSGPVFIDSILENNKSVTIVATGPFSNISEILLHGKNLHNLSKIVIMGTNFGSLMEPIDYNVRADIDAAINVLSTDIPTKIVPANATWDLILWDRYYNKLKSGSKACRSLYELEENLLKSWGEGEKSENLPVMFDSFTFSTIIDENMGYYHSVNVSIDNTGRTTIDQKGKTKIVYQTVDTDKFYDFFTHRICK
jgi:purine nucleosidase/pyrimidine-specific ribonucleoside hydrolase